MLNEPPSSERRPHPLERRPTSGPPPAPGEPPRQRVTLHIPTVRPLVVYTIIAINVALFVIRALSPTLDEQIFEWGANMPSQILLKGEYYRLFTSMFLHAGIYGPFGGYALSNALHIVFNMYLLYMIGSQLEPLFGHVRFALIYLLGGLGGSVLSTILSGPNIASVGASGAVFAIIGAEFVYLYKHRKLLGGRAQAQMRSLIIWGMMNFAFGALTAVAGTSVRVDNWAHLGGLLGGVSLAWFIGPLFIPKRHPDHPNELLAEDINPLKRRYVVLSLYISALLALLIVGALLARR
jgi:rhomboid protease GluP